MVADRPPAEDVDVDMMRKEVITTGGDAHPLLGKACYGAKIIPEMATEREESSGEGEQTTRESD